VSGRSGWPSGSASYPNISRLTGRRQIHRALRELVSYLQSRRAIEAWFSYEEQ
jgi:hypothetical protein